MYFGANKQNTMVNLKLLGFFFLWICFVSDWIWDTTHVGIVFAVLHADRNTRQSLTPCLLLGSVLCIVELNTCVVYNVNGVLLVEDEFSSMKVTSITVITYALYLHQKVALLRVFYFQTCPAAHLKKVRNNYINVKFMYFLSWFIYYLLKRLMFRDLQTYS